MDIENYYVVEYSLEQKAYHICTIREMLQSNWRLLAEGIVNGYVPLVVVPTKDQARDAAKKIKEVVGRPSSREDLKEQWPEYFDLDNLQP